MTDFDCSFAVMAFMWIGFGAFDVMHGTYNDWLISSWTAFLLANLVGRTGNVEH